MAEKCLLWHALEFEILAPGIYKPVILPYFKHLGVEFLVLIKPTLQFILGLVESLRSFAQTLVLHGKSID